MRYLKKLLCVACLLLPNLSGAASPVFVTPVPNGVFSGNGTIVNGGIITVLNGGELHVLSGGELIADNGAIITGIGGGTGGGTVTSVAATVPSFLSISGSPITTSGTLAITLANANANTVFAGPSSGSAAPPSFRALVAADIPVIPMSDVIPNGSSFGYVVVNSAGTALTYTGASSNQVAIINGSGNPALSSGPPGSVLFYDPNISQLSWGTALQDNVGVASVDMLNRSLDDTDGTAQFIWASGPRMPQLTANGALTLNTTGYVVSTALSNNQFLAWISGAPAAQSFNSTTVNTNLLTWAGSTSITTLGTIGTGTWQATKVAEDYGGTNQSSYTTGDLLYASATNTLSKRAAGTNGYVLTMVSGVPNWAASGSASIPAANITAGTLISTILATNSTVADNGNIITGHDLLGYTPPINVFGNGTSGNLYAYVLGSGNPVLVGDGINATLSTNGTAFGATGIYNHVFITNGPDPGLIPENNVLAIYDPVMAQGCSAMIFIANVSSYGWFWNGTSYDSGNYASHLTLGNETGVQVGAIGYMQQAPNGSGQHDGTLAWSNMVYLSGTAPLSFPDGSINEPNGFAPAGVTLMQEGWDKDAGTGTRYQSQRFSVGGKVGGGYGPWDMYWYDSSQSLQMRLYNRNSNNPSTALVMYGGYNTSATSDAYSITTSDNLQGGIMAFPSNSTGAGVWGFKPDSLNFFAWNNASGGVNVADLNGTVNLLTGGSAQSNVRLSVANAGNVTIDGNTDLGYNFGVNGTALVTGNMAIGNVTVNGTSNFADNITVTAGKTVQGQVVTVSSNIDATATGNTTIYTPNSGKNATIVSIAIENLVTTAITVPAQITFSAGATTNNVTVGLTLTSASAGQEFKPVFATMPYICTNAAPLTARITVGATATTYTVKIVVTAIEY